MQLNCLNKHIKINLILIILIRKIIKFCKYIYSFYLNILFILRYKYLNNNLTEEKIFQIGVFFTQNRIFINKGKKILENFNRNSIFYRQAQFFLGCLLFNNYLNSPKKMFNNFFINNSEISDIILNFYPPQIYNTLIDQSFNLDSAISKLINAKSINSLFDEKQIKIYKFYQSQHNLHYHQDFVALKNYIEDYLNNNIKKYYFSKETKGKFKINKMWFVISSKGMNIESHNHPEGVISGIFYYKVPLCKNPGYLIIDNPKKNIVINSSLNNLKVENKIIIAKPEYNNLIIFNSYLSHSVVNQETDDFRISIPWDADFII
jgi:uncharacterized protein (TIGR02466 family)